MSENNFIESENDLNELAGRISIQSNTPLGFIYDPDGIIKKLTHPPSHDALKSHFERAKEIRCLNSGLVIGVNEVTEFEYHEDTNSWTSMGSTVAFWKDGQFADITRKKCDPSKCKGCRPCAEKSK